MATRLPPKPRFVDVARRLRTSSHTAGSPTQATDPHRDGPHPYWKLPVFGALGLVKYLPANLQGVV
jgi:hypothetical protein